MESTKYKELKRQYNLSTDEKEKVDLMIEMALEIRMDDTEKAMTLAEEIIKRSEDVNYVLGIGHGLNHKGACYWLMGEYEDGLDELTAAHAIALEIGNKDLEARVLNNFGRIYRSLGNLASAINSFEASLEINEDLDLEINQTINLTNISNLYYDLGDYDTALEYALKCLPIFEKHDNVARLIDIYHTLGDIYFKKENYEEALWYFQKNRELTEPETSSRSLADSGIGKVYFKTGDFENAKKYLDTALVQAKELESPEAEIAAEYYTGKLMLNQHYYREALKHIENAHELALDASRKHDLISTHEVLSDLYDKMGDVPKAFYHLKEYEKIKEAIFQQTTINKLRNLQIKNQIEVAKKETEVAERTARLKQQFMANMSHEIRTPMNAIVGIIRLLIDRNPQPEQLKYFNAIKKSADSLLVIINDILDLSKIEAGKIEIECMSFSLRELIKSMKEIMQIKAEEKSLFFEIDVENVIPDKLMGDPTRINQILINLVGNAVKFTEKGGVKLKVIATFQDENEVVVQFQIIDTGIGISKEYVEKIFESFTQAGTDTARKYGGTGLGLTISKQLVDLMKGNISVDSEPNKGTTFFVNLPLEIAASQEEEVQEAIISNAIKDRLSKSKILLVEDNEFNRLVAEETLKDSAPGIRIEIAVNGARAVEMIERNDYDLVLMDIQMPVMNGVEATQHIRQQLKAPKNEIRIIAMTANVLTEDVQIYMEAGVNGYISKPFQTEELLLKMTQVLEGRELVLENETHSKDDNSYKSQFKIPEHVTDMSFLNNFTKGDRVKRNKYINMFLENGPALLQKIKQSLVDKDYPTMKVAAHSMKPQLSYMGVPEEVSHVFLLEQSAGEKAQYDIIPQLVKNLEVVCHKAFDELRAIIE